MLVSYDNISGSLSQSLDTYSLDLDLNNLNSASLHHSTINSASFAGGGPRLRPRSAKSVEDILDRRISSLSTTSGCSDCTITTLQDDLDQTAAGSDAPLTLLSTDTHSLSSAGVILPSRMEAVADGIGRDKEGKGDEEEDEESKNRTLTREKSPPPAVPPKPSQKPAIPAKPTHIRPGLKPVKIPKIDDKILLSQSEALGPTSTDVPPPKPPRRNVSVSPTRNEASLDMDELNLSSMESCRTAYSSKSCDELDDLMNKDGARERGKSYSKFEDEVKNPSSSSASNADVVSRHSCDEVMMTRSFHEGETSDTSSQLSSDCQRCLLNSISNRTMSLDCEGFWTSSGQARLISQRQYKRKIKRDTPSYVTLERRRGDKKSSKGSSANKEEEEEDQVDGFLLDNGLDTIKVSKTTYKLETQLQEPDSIELMEIPTSPTNYDQPSTPEFDPPSPAQAEEEIFKVIERLSKESKRNKRSKETEIEEAYLFPLGKRNRIEHNNKSPQLVSIGVGTDSDDFSTRTIFSHTNKIMELDITEDSSFKEPNKEESPPTPNDSGTAGGGGMSSSTENTRTSSILSPFDEKDEWLKISAIIDSFGTDIVGVDAKIKEDEEKTEEGDESPQYSTWKRQEKVLKSVPEWLQYISCQQYADNFEVNGYDHLDFIGENFISKEDLLDMGIKNENDCKHILESLQSRKLSPVIQNDAKSSQNSLPEEVDIWLESLHLSDYSKEFKSNNYDDMNRVKKIWDEELRTLLNVHKKGHRKRMLLSLLSANGTPTSGHFKSGFTAIDNRCKPPPAQQPDATASQGSTQHVSSVDSKAVAGNAALFPKQGSKKKGGEGSPSKTPPPASKAVPPPPKLLKSKTTLMGRESLNLSGSNILSTTLGRRKKKNAAPSTPLEGSKKSGTKEEKTYLSYGVKYFGKKPVKEFKGNDSTKSAIEQIRRAKAGRLRYILINDKTVTVIKRDTKEAVEVHNIDNICCVVHDKNDPRILGYISNDSQKLTHVFSTDCKEKTSEILSTICEGFGEMKGKVKYQDPILPSAAGVTPGVLGSPSVTSSGSDTKASSPPSPVSKSKSDFLVSRMKLFFQGSSSSSANDSPSSSGPPSAVQSGSSTSAKSQEARRKRGGSVDDLIDRLDEPLSNESRLKSISTKNLNVEGSRATSSSSTSSGAKSTVEEVKITTV